MSFFRNIYRHRFGPLAVVAFVVTLLSFITRLFLFYRSWPNLELNLLNTIGIFAIGFFYDLVVACFFGIPVALYCWLMKDSWYQKKWNRIPLFIMFFLICLILVINMGSEIAFWEEFNVRFNFIAVDYLIYTNEVIGNIWESYNIPLIGSGFILFTILLLIWIRKRITASQLVSMRFAKRSLFLLVYLTVTAGAYFLVNNKLKNTSNNNYVNELGGNGIYEFGSAFWHNEIDYKKFYIVHDDKQNMAVLRNMLQEPGTVFSPDPLGITRTINCDSAEKKWNVVLISVESLSGDYLKIFGGKDNITPYLDSLIPHGLFFKNFYASGTRTVRGLEALSLAIAPTPGQSIVRRPGNEDMFTMGSVLKEKNYDVKYIYGGNSFFDNMGYFFSHNSYQVIDKRDIPENRIHHETVWGVADEDAFSIALDECDKSYTAGKPFFNHIMTVSNHRPYTYPDGRIDIPSASQSWMGAVKYTDYAINAFLKDAQKKPWFNNTLFVIVADHCSSSAGKTDLPVTRYHIPCLLYAPALVKPTIEERFTSQIDLAPTVLGMMNLDYTSTFMGYDMFRLQPGKERIFISTYQDMGYVKHDTLVILSPQRKMAMYKTDFATGQSVKIPNSEKLANEAIAWYQGASFLFTEKRYKKNGTVNR
jgi:phosphoglycerol transferase MdoB-like AlkP superfamily enzyme